MVFLQKSTFQDFVMGQCVSFGLTSLILRINFFDSIEPGSNQAFFFIKQQYKIMLFSFKHSQKTKCGKKFQILFCKIYFQLSFNYN